MPACTKAAVGPLSDKSCGPKDVTPEMQLSLSALEARTMLPQTFCMSEPAPAC